MRAGALDRQIYVFRVPATALATPNAYGVVRSVHAQSVPMRAELVEQNVSEEAHDSGSLTNTHLTFRLRFLAHVKPGDRLSYDNRNFDIVKVTEIGRRKGLEIVVKERPDR